MARIALGDNLFGVGANEAVPRHLCLAGRGWSRCSRQLSSWA